ncbi:MAG TPA: hypothetical protein DCP91_12340 [Eggerthellaceae bacterium]|nr:hypothetical protein [Eggerthellaceae bacterium]
MRPLYLDEFEAEEITAGEDDCGIDGIAFLIDGELATTPDEADELLSRPKTRIPVEIHFILSKTSESYKRGEILKFGNGIIDFVSENPKLPQGDFIKRQRGIFELVTANVSKVANGRAIAHLHYICTSTDTPADEIEATRLSILENIERTGYFHNVTFEYIGVNELIALWAKTHDFEEATVTVEEIVSYPREMPGIYQAFVAFLPASEFVDKILSDKHGKLKTRIYDDNVRDYQGESNAVNGQIKQTVLDPVSCGRFAILNNGITVVASEVRIAQRSLHLKDYQIVNGCQTSNVLYECREHLDSSTLVTLKVVQAEDLDVVDQIVRATNSQSQVDETQFFSSQPFAKRIEQFFAAISEEPNREVELFFERRRGQYDKHDISKNRIVTLNDACRAVGAMFLKRPDLACRYPTRMIKDLKDKLFDPTNKEIIFYTASLALYRLKLLIGAKNIDSKYSVYRWHILMIIGSIANEQRMPRLNSSKINDFCEPIIRACSQPGPDCIELFDAATRIIDVAGLRPRDETRTTAYTEALKRACSAHRRETRESNKNGDVKSCVTP